MASVRAGQKAQTSLTMRVVLVWGVILVAMFTVIPQSGYQYPSGPFAVVLRACIVVLLAHGLYVSRNTARESTSRKVIAIVWMTVASLLAMSVVEGVVWLALRLVLRV